MRWVKSIESILGHIALYKSSSAIIKQNNGAGEYCANYSIVYHQGKSKKAIEPFYISGKGKCFCTFETDGRSQSSEYPATRNPLLTM